MSVEEVAMGFIRVANEAMCRPIRALTQVFGVLKSQLHPECLVVIKCLKSGFFFHQYPLRLRVMIPLSMCWHVSGVQVANTPVLLPEPWA